MATTDLMIREDQTGFDAKQLAALTQLGVAGASNADLAVFFHYSRMTGLDPFLRQIYMIGRRVKEGDSWVTRQTIQTGIDGFRLISSRQDSGRSMSPVEWLRESDMIWVGAWSIKWGYPVAARVTLTKGNGAMFTAVANFDEYKQTVKGGTEPNSMWKTKPALMIGKCAEALVLRMAYPQSLSGLYTEDEMPAPEGEVVVEPLEERVIQPPSRVIESSPVGKTPSAAPSLRDTRSRRPRGSARAVVDGTPDGGEVEAGAYPPSPPTVETVDEATGEIVDAEIVGDEIGDPETLLEETGAVEMASEAQKKMMFALMGQIGLREREECIQFARDACGDQSLQSRNDLTMVQCAAVIDALQQTIAAIEKGDVFPETSKES